MPGPISIRLDETVRTLLEEDARAQGVGISTYLRELATSRARELRRMHLRAQSRRLGEYVRENAEAGAFYDDVGTPTADLD